MCSRISVVLFTILFAASFARADGTTGKGTSEKLRVNKEFADNVVEERDKLIGGLIEIVSSEQMRKNERETVVIAIDLLGKLRAREATQILASLLLYGRTEEEEYDEDGEIESLRVPRKSFPAVAALINIGVPALDEMIRIIASAEETPQGLFASRHCLIVVRRVLALELAEAFLEMHIKRAATDKEKQKLIESRNIISRLLEIRSESQ